MSVCVGFSFYILFIVPSVDSVYSELIIRVEMVSSKDDTEKVRETT